MPTPSDPKPTPGSLGRYTPPRMAPGGSGEPEEGKSGSAHNPIRYDSIQVETGSLDELIRLLKEDGLPLASFERLRGELGVSGSRLAEIIHVAERTLRRRRQAGRLRPDESERLLRLARLFERAREVLGSSERARMWMSEPVPALGGHTPLAYADTEPGAREVERVLGRIAHGVFS